MFPPGSSHGGNTTLRSGSLVIGQGSLYFNSWQKMLVCRKAADII